MNSVALPVATAPARSAEVDLARRAARADRSAFEELFRRHAQTAWRLAAATASDLDTAAVAVSAGFAKATRGSRRASAVGGNDRSRGEFRPVLLAAVYSCAMADSRHSRAAAPIPIAERRSSPARTEARTAAAFRSLPDRWRAALWLSEVEGMGPARVAVVLGVSVPVSTQLIERSRRALLSRMAQTPQTLPEHLGLALRPLAAPAPAELAELTAVRWRKAVAARVRWFEPVGRLGDAATRYLAAACAGLVALSVVGLGMAGLRGGVRS
ncbi:MAG: RNA polymerase sigma factor, partial [Acidimicrobiales bacterium]